MATFDSGRCTARGCARKIKDGDGVQVQREDGDIDRFCWGCWTAQCAAAEANAAATEPESASMDGLRQGVLWPTTATIAG